MRQNKNVSSAVDITDIADWFLSKDGITHKKLQKLCYYAVAWGWALMGKKIANRERFEAWVHGPVSPTLYAVYKNSGWNELKRKKAPNNLPVDVLELLESVWLTYGDKSGNELEALSHNEQPWKKARAGLMPNDTSKNIIEPKDMTEFYNSIKSTDY